MEFGVGLVCEGKVTGITKFGAFVSLPENKSGMVHISEIAQSYVEDIRDHLTEGQPVTVKVIGIDDIGRINLSIKKAMPESAGAPAPRPSRPPRKRPENLGFRGVAVAEPQTFEDKLSKFMKDSKSNLTGSKTYSERGSSRRARR